MQNASLVKLLDRLLQDIFYDRDHSAYNSKYAKAFSLCKETFRPAVDEVDVFVKSNVICPLSHVINKSLSSVILNMHKFIYSERQLVIFDRINGKSFAWDNLNKFYEYINTRILTHLSREYAEYFVSNIISSSIYYFVSNTILIRPLTYSLCLCIVNNLATLEYVLGQLILKSKLSLTFSRIKGGRPYAELRAVHHLLFWSGLNDAKLSPAYISKMLLQEVWIKDIRPSVILYFLFTFVPRMISSPQDHLCITIDENIKSLVKSNGPFFDCELNALLTMCTCIEFYQTKVFVDQSFPVIGYKRVLSVLNIVGPELWWKNNSFS